VPVRVGPGGVEESKMRLVCPSCAAEYEVDGGAIPPEGRDVQCSNCGHTWLQFPEGHEPESPETSAPEATGEGAHASAAAPDDEQAVGPAEAESDGIEAEEAAAETPAEDARPAEAPEGADLDAEVNDLSARPRSDDGATEPDKPSDTAPSQEAPSARRPPLDPAVIAILREEAEREARVRREEQDAALEVQPDLGLVETSRPERPAVAEPRRAQPVSESPQSAAPVQSAAGNRGRDRLPDIEEFDTGRPEADTRAKPAPRAFFSGEEDSQRSGFRSGFLLAILIFAILAALYGLSEPLAEAIPAAQPALAAYATIVESARAGLDAAMRSAVEAVTGLVARLRA